ARAEQAAKKLGIAKSYGSYDALLADPEIDAIYNPLPNHLHVPLSVQAAEAGKHVLCEKPIALTVAEAKELLAARNRTGVKIQEAFMVRTNLQWLGVRDLIRDGRIGKLRSVLGYFSYLNLDPRNIRNMLDIGGGAVMDIGCYPITTSRFTFEEEPTRVVACVERDPEMKIDRLTSAILDFPSGQSIFTCSTQMVPYQRMHFFGEKGRIEVEVPFNAPNRVPCRVFVDDGSDTRGGGVQTIELPVCDQYTLQGDAFAKAILDDGPVPVPLEDAVKNMAVIEAVLRSGATGTWETPQS
ncbi:MAG TPA: Gfo/Idh/MocA family oxidoreductase, partial [Planctomycetota bacterium]|nr:Gfo/Idh/MocA family oxidoreductase [Planctomycetota bacterium]